MCSNSFRFDASTAVRAVRFSNMALLATLDCSLGSVRRYFPGQFLRNSFLVEKSNAVGNSCMEPAMRVLR
jgi:small basic protein